MTTAEIVSKYGIPIPETCEKLDWQDKTILHYVKSYSGLLYVCFKDNKNRYIEAFTGDMILSFVSVFPAPQMHEIMSLLPPKIEGFLEPMYLDLVSAPYHNKSCFFLQYTGVKSKKDYFTSMRIDDFHFAQEYAELYLKLKNEGLIS
jgi:hypothetical protein